MFMKSCGCGPRPPHPCPVTPICLPERVCTVHRCTPYDQPVIMPVRTHVVNHFVPQLRLEVARSVSEEMQCHTHSMHRPPHHGGFGM